MERILQNYRQLCWLDSAGRANIGFKIERQRIRKSYSSMPEIMRDIFEQGGTQIIGHRNCLKLLRDGAHIYNKQRITLLLFLKLFFWASVSFAAQNCPTEDIIEIRGITLRDENDSFAKTDRNYTQGLALTAESHNIKNYDQTECLPLLLRAHSKLFRFLTPRFLIPDENSITSNSIVIKLGQSIYTPKNSSSPDLILNDRPYAGLLYVGMSLHQRHKIPQSDLEILDMSEITLGVIGPLSFAKEFQDAAHNLMGDEKFQGWGHQLNNEPALQLALDKKFKDYRGSSPVLSGFSADLIQSIGVRMGNIETSANVGLEGRIGWDIPNDFGSFTIRPGTDSRPPDVVPIEDSPAHFGFHLFTILDVKLVGYSFAVDGNLFSTSHHVTRQPWVAFGAIGLSFPTIIKRRSYNLAIMQVYQSSDFKEQDAHHAYRSIALGIEF